jgi:hypothetical protein
MKKKKCERIKKEEEKKEKAKVVRSSIKAKNAHVQITTHS